MQQNSNQHPELLRYLGTVDTALSRNNAPVNPFTVAGCLPALPGETQGEYEMRLKEFLSPGSIERIRRWVRRMR